ncbi:MAG: hypothetical protein LBC92_00970 [Rickettsiales bacterium]|jgi:uncharacterized protein YkuJ|nr:hypothetical protein [Rickettsiales bacterium]
MKFLFFYLFLITISFASICRLNEPDTVVDYYFLNDGYKINFYDIDEVKSLKFEEKSGYKFDDSDNVKYAIYDVLKNTNKGYKVIGYIFCVNEKYSFNNMEITAVYDANGTLKKIYYQKLISENSYLFRDQRFLSQFLNIKNKGFNINNIKNPSPRDADIFESTKRAVMKNITLFNFFVFNK